jgi:hypothetical protein
VTLLVAENNNMLPNNGLVFEGMGMAQASVCCCRAYCTVRVVMLD